MKIEQVRNGDCIEVFFYPKTPDATPIAWLFDGDNDFIVDDMGAIFTLKLHGHLPQDYKLPLTAAEARLIDAARIPDIRL